MIIIDESTDLQSFLKKQQQILIFEKLANVLALLDKWLWINWLIISALSGFYSM